MIRMMASDPLFLGPVNLGNPNEFTMIELAQAVIRLTNSKSTIVHMPLPLDDPKQRQPDISLAKEKLQCWGPKTELNAGLIKTISYFESVL
jgi:UDP-glucuronate decarboxylase